MERGETRREGKGEGMGAVQEGGSGQVSTGVQTGTENEEGGRVGQAAAKQGIV